MNGAPRPCHQLKGQLAVPGARLVGAPRLQVQRCARINGKSRLSDKDLVCLEQAARLSLSSEGVSQPHPNAGCLLVDANGRELAATYQLAQGTVSAEVQAIRQVSGAAEGSTVYLNLETGDCHGDESALRALIEAGVSRVVIGLKHPLSHLRGEAIMALRQHGVQVQVLGEAPCRTDPDREAAVLQSCLQANEALLHRATLHRPFSLLKYAMTLDGKIATHTGHSAWVSSPQSRACVFEARARSDAVIVGGNTVRRDNPRLTTRREGGHTPVRVVMSRTLDLPEDANLWDVALAPTIVMTQRGARSNFQDRLRQRGVEVVEFDFLTPEAVADYCYERGFLQCFWECGGTLAAPAISSGIIHKVMAFIAPKIIGGTRAPTPVGDLGFVEMTQAVQLVDTSWHVVGPDMMLTGYLPSSGGLAALERCLTFPGRKPGGLVGANSSLEGSDVSSANGSAAMLRTTNGLHSLLGELRVPENEGTRSSRSPVVSFYKAWDQWGALSNFSPHPITLPPMVEDEHDYSVTSPGSSGLAVLGVEDGGGWQAAVQGSSRDAASQRGGEVSASGHELVWNSVEHYYQAHKFIGVDSVEARNVVQQIMEAESPEEAARIGRRIEKTQSKLVRHDWATRKQKVMYAALRAKFLTHEGPRKMLLSTAGDELTPPAELVENSPHDFYWGQGYDGMGANNLGRLLMRIRDELVEAQRLVPEMVATAR